MSTAPNISFVDATQRSGSPDDLRITLFSDLEKEASRWDKFVSSHPDGTVFHLSNWQRTVASSFGHQQCHLVAEDRDSKEFLGILPLFLVKSLLFGRMLISTPQAAYGGILARSPAVTAAIFDRARFLAQEAHVRFLELRNFRLAQIEPSLVTRDLYVTFRQELFADPERNLAVIPRKTRAEIREGIRNGLEFNVDAITVDEFYDIYSKSVRHLGTPVFPRTLFEEGLRQFGDECRIFSVHWKGVLVSAVWTLFYKDEVLPYYGGSLREYNHLPVNNFMYWMLIKWGCESGYRVYDFGRSKKGTGSFDFKKRWGMTMTDLPYQHLLVKGQSMPDTSPLNPKFSRAIRVWRRLPLSVTQAIGPLIARHLT